MDGKIQLRDYQAECVSAIMRALTGGESPAVAVSLPTGAGKTIVFSALIREWERIHPGAGVMILAHRNELLDQAERKCRLVNPGMEIGLVKAERHEIDAPIVIASVQSMNAARLRRLGEWRPGLLIVDECHHAASPSYRKVIEWAQAPTVGVTATLSRADGIALKTVFSEIVYEKSILWMIRNGYLCDVEGRRVVVSDLDLGGVPTRAGDYAEGELGRRVADSSTPAVVAEVASGIEPGRAGIVFAPSVSAVLAITSAMTARGLRSAAIWGSLNPQQRATHLDDYAAGRLDWLVNCSVLTEGFDAPRAKVAVLAHPTRSSVRYTQMVGRILRPYGDARALVLHVTPGDAVPGLSDLATLAGQEPADRDAQSLLDLYGAPCPSCGTPRDECSQELPCCQKCDHWPAPAPTQGPGRCGDVRTEAIDVFGGTRPAWLSTTDGHQVLCLPDRILVVAQDSTGAYSVHSRTRQHAVTVTVSRHASQRGALARAEALITDAEEVAMRRRRGVRNRRPSARQLETARRLRCLTPGMEDMRAGEVSDIIDVRLQGRRIDQYISARNARIGDRERYSIS